MSVRKTAKTPPPKAEAPADTVRGQGGVLFDDFVAAKVITLATLLRRASALRFQRMFGLDLVEWRLLIRIGASGPLSLNQLADHIGISKSQASRVVSGMVVNGLVRRERSPANPREVELTLTDDGLEIHRGIIKAGVVRNQELISGVAPADLSRVNDVLTILTEHAREFLQKEQEICADRTPASDADLTL